jgi:transposase
LRKAHYLRELQALIDIEKEDWARKMQVLLRRACRATNLAREFDVALTGRLIARIQRRYDAILAEGIAFHEEQPPLRRAQRHGRKPRRVGHNLILRLQQHRDDALCLVGDPDVPFTNTQAERDARM